MIIAIYESNHLLIKALQDKTEHTIVPFVPNLVGSCFTQNDVSVFVQSINNRDDVLFLISLECSYDYQLRSNLLGLYFFQCLIAEFGSSKSFNYCFYSFLPIQKMIELNDYAFFIKPDKHKQLPYNFHEII